VSRTSHVLQRCAYVSRTTELGATGMEIHPSNLQWVNRTLRWLRSQGGTTLEIVAYLLGILASRRVSQKATYVRSRWGAAYLVEKPVELLVEVLVSVVYICNILSLVVPSARTLLALVDAL
jgi:hypothetical protein